MGKRAIAIQSPKIRISDIQQETFIYADDTGTANNYAVALNPAPTIVEGSVVVMKALHTNTGASTLNVNSLGATPIKIRTNVALTGGEILAGEISVLVFDGTIWQIISGVTWGTISDIQQQKYTYAADSGSANAYAVTLTPSPIAIAAGSIVVFKAANANTGASTLAVNGGSATAIKKQGSTALIGGEIASGEIIVTIFDGTNWQILGGSSILLQTNGVNNGSQIKLDLVAGTGLTITDDGTGDITFAVGSIVQAISTLYVETPAGTINGSNATFTLSNSPNPASSLQLYVNGVFQVQGIDYAVSTNTIVFTHAPSFGSQLVAFYRYGGSASANFSYDETPSGSVNGSNVTFTLAHAPVPSLSLQLYVNGVLQLQGGTNYTLSGATITFINAPSAGAELVAFYGYNASAATGYADNETPLGTVNGSNTSFSLANAPNPANSLQLFVNGIMQLLGTDYTLSGSGISFSNAPSSGAILRAFYRY